MEARSRTICGTRPGPADSEIGFPEFTTKLVIEVFDVLVSVNLR
jgi:hypothetical protein